MAGGLDGDYSNWSHEHVSYRITYVVEKMPGGGIDPATLDVMLDALTRIGMIWLIQHPETPNLYESGVRYQEEPPGAEDWADIPTCLKLGWGDCLPLETLVLREDYTFTTIGSLKPGDRIMGDGLVTTVIEGCVTGTKDILAFDLDNGCTLRCSQEHQVFLTDGTVKRAKDVQVGDHLKTPSDRFAVENAAIVHDERLDPIDSAWLLGVYTADGWHEKRGHRFSISGDDANPKRGKIEQKDRVRLMCSDAGIATRDDPKSITVNDRVLTHLMSSCGPRAPEKSLPSLAFSKEQVDAVIEGLQTDSSIATSGTITHGTTSETLALQLRVLYRMRGQSLHIRRWDDHGGLGTHPIYRATVRKEESKRYNAHCAVVRGIRQDEPALCGDITTDSGCFYLPESDVVVHNCEDLACWRAAELRVRHGVEARAFAECQMQPDGSRLYHIMVSLPDGSTECPSRELGMR